MNDTNVETVSLLWVGAVCATLSELSAKYDQKHDLTPAELV